ncbi:MAG TPA: type I-E CRISPR-associated protein Cse1/CasA [Methanomassiliicoccales archaeon]|jgi:CRISPR system Cascade subunit CasA
MKFNLLDERWIPCLMKDGKMDELSIRQLVVGASDIVEIIDESPLVRCAIHRLLLAILHRNLGPVEESDWGKIWTDGQWDIRCLDAYIDKWHGSFDIFDEARPFYQTKEVDGKLPVTIAKIVHEMSSGNNPAWFDHRWDDSPPIVPAAEAARYLIAAQAYSLSGLSGSDTNFEHAPLVSGAAIFLKGASVFETLTLNLIRYDGKNAPLPCTDDKPSWEASDEAVLEVRREPHGYLDYLTWQSRAIRLVPEEVMGNRYVSRVKLGVGRMFPKNAAIIDPSKAFRKVNDRGFVPISFDPDRAFWRNSLVLLRLPRSNGDTVPPYAMKWVSGFVNDSIVDSSRVFSIEAFGLVSNKPAKVDLWRHEVLPIPARYLQDELIVDALGQALDIAEKGGIILNVSVREAFRWWIDPTDGKPERDELAERVRASSIPRQYWATLEGAFRRFIFDLVSPTIGIDTDEGRVLALKGWAQDVVAKEARKQFNRLYGELPENPAGLKAIVKAQGRFLYGIKEISDKYGGE